MIVLIIKNVFQLFHDGRPYYLGISRLICKVNQWTGFYMIGTCVMKQLTHFRPEARFYPPENAMGPQCPDVFRGYINRALTRYGLSVF